MGDANIERLWQWGRSWRTASGGGVFVDSATGEVELDQFDPDVVYEDATLPDHIGETYRGHEGVARAIKRWSEPYRELTVDLEQVYGSGDCVVSIHRVRATALYSGLAIEMPLAYLWRFRAGKVVYFRSFRDPAEALTAAGLSGTEPTSSGPPPDRPASTRSE
jgi:ketosteroid isomerase-like protein